ncbi:MAG TPA: type II secretion system F family protein [Candidatus Nanoarchaeia archaeon]|nr:type II secretion system F family protein [Candidatus Nanoarchaeia archaeon]
MLSKKDDFFLDLKNSISKEIKTARELGIFLKELAKRDNVEEKREIQEEIKSLKEELRKANDKIPGILENIPALNQLKNYIPKSAEKNPKTKPAAKGGVFDFLTKFQQKSGLDSFEKETLKRLGRREEEKIVVAMKIKKPSRYVRLANKFFSDYSMRTIKKWDFKQLQADITKANMNSLLRNYISVIFLTTSISFIISFFAMIFLLFFNVSAQLPIITLSEESMLTRFLKVFWIIFIVPISTGLFMYFYPSFEKDSIERRIDLELPFAAINMSAISGSMIDPTKIFNIIISTKEYPCIEREFIKLLNSINVLGLDLVTALRNSTATTASRKLAELLNGLAITISSGGDMPKFFEERAESLLFEYHLDKEKNTKTAETFMDIYISVVIAAPMILMLLLMMMRISGLGLTLSAGAITLIMILGVVGINIGFLVFLQIKQPNV